MSSSINRSLISLCTSTYRYYMRENHIETNFLLVTENGELYDNMSDQNRNTYNGRDRCDLQSIVSACLNLLERADETQKIAIRSCLKTFSSRLKLSYERNQPRGLFRQLFNCLAKRNLLSQIRRIDAVLGEELDTEENLNRDFNAIMNNSRGITEQDLSQSHINALQVYNQQMFKELTGPHIRDEYIQSRMDNFKASVVQFLADPQLHLPRSVWQNYVESHRLSQYIKRRGNLPFCLQNMDG